MRDGASGPEIFMVRRREGSAFMGGAYVFPGGRVDATDRDGDASHYDGVDDAVRRWPDLTPADALGYAVAAARELFEEAGLLPARRVDGVMVSIDAGNAAMLRYRHDIHDGKTTFAAMLDREGLRLALDALLPFAHWVTPPIDVRQFDTRFFVTRVPPNQTPAHDTTETTQSAWLSPRVAIAQAIAGEIVLPPPTWTTLRELERFDRVDEAMAWARTRRISRRQPKAIEADGQRMLLLPGDPDYPEAADPEAPVETRFVFAGNRWRAERASA